MELRYCSTKLKKYTHLQEKDRYKLESLLENKQTVASIAVQLGKHPSSIYREMQRGSVQWLQYDLSKKKRYRADVGQRIYEEQARNKARSLKIGSDHRLAAHIRKKLVHERYSPDAIIGEIKRKGWSFERMICTKTLYNYIDAGIFAGIGNETLWEKRKRKKRRYKAVRRIGRNNRLGRSIEERPVTIENRTEYGHWEGDCIKGTAKSRASLLTLTERKTLEEIIIKLKGSTQEEVKKAFDKLERKYGAQFTVKFKSVTFDNGNEFVKWSDLEVSALDESKKRMIVYYAHAYSAWERGSNENQNRMIRRFIPKGTPLEHIQDEDINRIEKWINRYPRKRLGYMSAKEAAETALQNNRQF